MSETTEDTILGDWVYCRQHMAPHRSGWCTVDLRDKVGLGVFPGAEHEQYQAAWDKCKYLELPLRD